MHLGLFEGYGEVVWDGQYRVPDDVVAEDTCDYPLARNIVLLTVAIATESLIRFVLDGEHVSRSITLGDFAVRPLLSPSSVAN